MKKIFLVACLILVPSFVSAGQFESITVSTTAVSFTAASYHPGTGTEDSKSVTCSVETSAIRVKYDGNAPTATVGVYIASGKTFTVTGYNNISRVKMIRDTAASSDATVQCMFDEGR